MPKFVSSHLAYFSDKYITATHPINVINIRAMMPVKMSIAMAALSSSSSSSSFCSSITATCWNEIHRGENNYKVTMNYACNAIIHYNYIWILKVPKKKILLVYGDHISLVVNDNMVDIIMCRINCNKLFTKYTIFVPQNFSPLQWLAS